MNAKHILITKLT